MSEDLYSVWLKVAPGPRPPDHYALLGVPRFCDNLQKLEAAAQTQLDILDRHSLHNDLHKRDACHQMMNEVARARVVLTTPAKRAAYDQTLDPSRVPAPVPVPVPATVQKPFAAPAPIAPKPIPVQKPVPAAAAIPEEPALENAGSARAHPKGPSGFSLLLARMKKDPVTWLTPVGVTLAIAGGIFFAAHRMHNPAPPNVKVATTTNGTEAAPVPAIAPHPTQSGNATPAISIAPPVPPVIKTSVPVPPPVVTPPTPAPEHNTTVTVPPPVITPPRPPIAPGAITANKPVPDADAQSKAAKLVDQIFADDLVGAGTAQAKTDLARKMLVLATRLNDDTNGQYILLTRAGDLAAQAGDINTAISAIDCAAKEFQIDGLHVKARALASVAKIITGTQDQQSFMRQTDAVIDEAMRTDRYDIASYSVDVARFAAETLNDPLWLQKADRQKKEIKTLEDEFAAIKDAAAVLSKNPADANANSKVGQFRCFIKGDWETGLPMLAAGSDPTTRALAATELSHPTDSSKIVTLADGWWTLGEQGPPAKQHHLQSHAAKLYLGVVSGLSEPEKSRVQKRIQDADQNAGRVVDLMQFIDPQRDAMQGKWIAQNGSLLTQPTSDLRWMVRIRYVPPEEYDFETEFTVPAKRISIEQYLTHEGHVFGWEMGPTFGKKNASAFVFDSVDHRLPNRTSVEGPILEGNQSFHSTVKVRRDSVTAWLNDRQMSEFKGDYSQLVLMKRYAFTPESMIGAGLGIAVNRSGPVGNDSWDVRFTKMQITEISGHGSPIPLP